MGVPTGALVGFLVGVITGVGTRVGADKGVSVRRKSTGNEVGEDWHTHSHSVGLDVGAKGRCSTGAFVCLGMKALGLFVGEPLLDE